MSTKSKSIQNKSSDERLRKVSKLKVLLNRPELGALGGSILVFIFIFDFNYLIFFKEIMA